MNRQRLALASAATCAVLAIAPGYSETLIPETIQYEYEVKEDAAAKACHIVLLLLNIPSPETVNFHFLITRPKSQGKLIDPVIIGFTIDVGELKFSNGLPAGATKIDLASAAFVSSEFTSAGRLNMAPFEDGGLLATTTDMNVGNQFLKALLSGQFELSFIRKGLSSGRTYKVSASVPVDVARQFQACLNTL